MDPCDASLTFIPCYFQLLAFLPEVVEVNKEVEGNLNMSPQNMPVWHESYFELKSIKKVQTQKKAPPFQPKGRI